MRVKCRGFEGALCTAIPKGAPIGATEFSSVTLEDAAMLDMSFQELENKCTIKFTGLSMTVYLSDVKTDEIEFLNGQEAANA